GTIHERVRGRLARLFARVEVAEVRVCRAQDLMPGTGDERSGPRFGLPYRIRACVALPVVCPG
ncbi:MAG TPA: hypothetical protein PKL59_21770, partial [Nitrospira sp.]|nr:hypothetical protein [Nitrospira sp.]